LDKDEFSDSSFINFSPLNQVFDARYSVNETCIVKEMIEGRNRMNVMLAFGWSSIMLLIGVLLRAKIPFLQRMLVPASVLGGIIGFVFINTIGGIGNRIGFDIGIFNVLVSQIFTISFISIGLTSTPPNESNSAKNTVKGTWALGIVWCLLYALTPLIGTGTVALVGNFCNMNPIYGMLIQFGFCQGPGQSATYGAIFEQYGWTNASMVAITFSAIGFVVAFLVGIPAAKFGIKKGIAKNSKELDEIISRGYLKKEEQTDVMVKDTTCNSNIETLAFHFALIGLCYVLAVGISKIFAFFPGFLGTSMSGMMFMNGMIAAYIVKFIMKRIKIDYLIDNTLQSKITGWTTDYLVVCAFMAISVSVIKLWVVPIIVVSVITTFLTFIISFYYGQRFGGPNDFERTLGLYGMCTGTVPTGVALVRIADPEFRTSTAVELGACNLVMMLFCTPTCMLILAYASGTIGINLTLCGLLLITIILLIILKVSRCWGKKSYYWK